MKFEVKARRVMSPVATGEPAKVTLRIRLLRVQTAGPFPQRLFTEGVVEGVAGLLSRHVERIIRSSSGLPERVAVSVPSVSMRMPANLGFGSGRKLGDYCAGAVATAMEKHRAS